MTIITINPKMTPIAAKFLLSLALSGINSEDTTEIIAPAAKANKKGSKLRTLIAAKAPITPATGSTNPEACPERNDFHRLYPSRRKGSETAAPSGKF